MLVANCTLQPVSRSALAGVMVAVSVFGIEELEQPVNAQTTDKVSTTGRTFAIMGPCTLNIFD